MIEAHSVQLKPGKDKRVRNGHPWVFSNEIASDVRAIPAGGVVDVFDHKGKFLGRGYGNPKSLITVRILSKARKEDIDHPSFFAMKLRQAAALREALYPDRRSLRLVFSEGDGLPGLVVDRFGDTLSVQLNTLGMETRRDAIAAALQEVFSPDGAVLRNDAAVRTLEGLERGREVWFGEPPEEVTIDEGGVAFTVPMLGGQKTGHFFDQYDNKRFAAGLCRGRSVLDVYANTGGWALHALAAGATEAVVVDSDSANAERARRNAADNGFGDRLEALDTEGKSTLQGFVREGRRFGCVVLDPPAFAKQRKAANSALRGYQEINALGCMLTEPGGFLFASTCSYHVEEAKFLEAVDRGAKQAGRKLTIVRRGEQAHDHPVLPAAPETRYLKSYAFRVDMDV